MSLTGRAPDAVVAGGTCGYGRPVESPTLDLLVPTARAGTVPPDPSEEVLRDLYGRHAGLRANMVSTLDGAAHGPDGRSGSINDAVDARVFAVLRSLADVVLVGAGTVRAEGYRDVRVPDALVAARRAAGAADHPTLAVVTRRGDLPVPVLTQDPAPWVLTRAGATYLGHLRAHVPPGRLVVHDGDDVDLAAFVTTLRDAGLTSVLAEGGPSLLGSLVTAGLVDELCLTWTPHLVGGDAGRVLDGVPWRGRERAELATLLHARGTLVSRWVLPR